MVPSLTEFELVPLSMRRASLPAPVATAKSSVVATGEAPLFPIPAAPPLMAEALLAVTIAVEEAPSISATLPGPDAVAQLPADVSTSAAGKMPGPVLEAVAVLPLELPTIASLNAPLA